MLKKLVGLPCIRRVTLWLLLGCLLQSSPTARGQLGKTLLALTAAGEDENSELAIWDLRSKLLFEARVRNYIHCLMEWAVRQADLSPEQQRMFSATLNSQVEELNRLRHTYDSGPYGGFLPVQFVKVASELDRGFERQVCELSALSEQQRQQLQDGLSERLRLRKKDNLQGLIFRVDRELFLTDPQVGLLSDLAGKHLDLDKAAFNFPLGANDLDGRWADEEQSLADVLADPSLAKAWADCQAETIAMLIDRDEQRRLRVDAEDFEVNRDRVIGRYLQWGAEGCHRITQMQLNVCLSEGLITEKQALRLRLDARQRVEKYLVKWKKWTTSTLDQWYQFADGDRWIEGRTPRLTAVSSSPGWRVQLQLESPRFEEFIVRRSATLRRRLADYMVGLLDRELWLTTSQRQTLRRHFEIAMPDDWLEPIGFVAAHADWTQATVAASIGLLDKTKYDQWGDSQMLAFWALRRVLPGYDNRWVEAPAARGTGIRSIVNSYSQEWRNE